MELIKKEFDSRIYIPGNLANYASGRKMVYFDIETMGLNPQICPVILIGMSYERNGKYIVEQIFAESLDEEAEILSAFRERLENFDTVVSYNGKNFDVPFINKRMAINDIDYSIKHEHFDIICHIRPKKLELGLQSCSLKNVERYLHLNREDTIDGAESIKLYNKYLRTGDSGVKHKIMLHNFEDVYNLPGILKVFDRIKFEESSGSNIITFKQKSFLNSLLKRNNLKLTVNIDKLSKNQASKLIDYMLNGSECEYSDYLEEIR